MLFLIDVLLLLLLQDDFEEERETNLSAVMAAMQLWGGTHVVSWYCPQIMSPDHLALGGILSGENI